MVLELKCLSNCLNSLSLTKFIIVEMNGKVQQCCITNFTDSAYSRLSQCPSKMGHFGFGIIVDFLNPLEKHLYHVVAGFDLSLVE